MEVGHWTVYGAVCSVELQFIVRIVQCALCIVHCALCSVQCAANIVSVVLSVCFVHRAFEHLAQ